MILWSLQDTAAYNALDRNGILKGDWRRPDHRGFLPAYKWMAEQMVERGILKKPRSFLWAWHTCHGKNKRKPDLRIICRNIRPLYRIEFEIPDDQVLLSDYMMWHMVLNADPKHPKPFNYLALNEKESKKMDRVKPTTAAIKKSWERIFDLDLNLDDEWWKQDRYIQACFPHIKKEWITDLTFAK